MTVPAQNIRARVAMVDQTVGTATANVYGNNIDCKSFDSATFLIAARSATTGSVLERVVIEHSETTDSTGFAAIATITSGLPTAINATAVSNQDSYGIINVDLRGKRRYLRVGFRSADTNTPTVGSICILDNPGQAPIAATPAGARFFRALG